MRYRTLESVVKFLWEYVKQLGKRDGFRQACKCMAERADGTFDEVRASFGK